MELSFNQWIQSNELSPWDGYEVEPGSPFQIPEEPGRWRRRMHEDDLWYAARRMFDQLRFIPEKSWQVCVIEEINPDDPYGYVVITGLGAGLWNRWQDVQKTVRRISLQLNREGAMPGESHLVDPNMVMERLAVERPDLADLLSSVSDKGSVQVFDLSKRNV